ncbi:hypothetical protein Gpo141_00014431 [Globisporangium polare]
METRAAFLRLQAATPPDIVAAAAQESENVALRRAIQSQLFTAVGAQALLADFSISHPLPFQSSIRLGRDCESRRSALHALRDVTLHNAARYLSERTQHLDKTQEYSALERHCTKEGDFCLTRLDVVPFAGGVATVKRVYDAVQHFFVNMEITMTAGSSNELMLREEDYSEDLGISQHRFLRSIAGLQVEINSAMFGEYQERTDEHEAFAVIAHNFIDDDALFPFRPTERVRQDTSTAITVRIEPATQENPLETTTQGSVVVLTLYSRFKLHRSTVVTTREQCRQLKAACQNCGEVLLQSVNEALD